MNTIDTGFDSGHLIVLPGKCSNRSFVWLKYERSRRNFKTELGYAQPTMGNQFLEGIADSYSLLACRDINASINFSD